MAITYPLSMPTPSPRAVEWHAVSDVGFSISPWNASQQVAKWQGEFLQAKVTLPQMSRANAENWIAFLLALRGRYGTFLLGDRAGKALRGTCTTCTINGSAQSGESLNVNTNGTLLRGDWLQVGPTVLATPAAPTLSAVVSGSLAGATYYVKISYTGPSGESGPSVESSLAVAANSVLSVASPAASTGATGWNVYVSTATGIETRQNGSSPIAIGSNWQEPNSGLVSGAALPVLISTYRLYKVLTDQTGTGNVAIDIYPRLREAPNNLDAVILANTVGQFRLTSNQTPWLIDQAAIFGLAFECMEAL